ncbi:MAG: VIT1/CCC1 transporter family protein [Patescibacteria group bacterium]
MAGGVWGSLRENVRDVVFGLEDSLVSTLGTITGVAVGTHNTFFVVLTGVVLVFVEAVSMAAGSYLSSKSAKELYDQRAKQDHARVLHERVSDLESLSDLFHRKGFSKSEVDVAVEAIGRERKVWLKEVARCEYRYAPSTSSTPVIAAMFMGGFYLLGGFFTFAPYLFVPFSIAIPLTIGMTLVALFLVGVLKAKLTGTNLWRSGLEMFIVSTSAAAIGYGLGVLVPMIFHAPISL